ncbi:hypothetical protein ACF0H5_023988 [Mactra antiquata]
MKKPMNWSSGINDRLSGFDSGKTHDVSEYRHGRHYGKDHGVSLLSVKSEPKLPSPKVTKEVTHQGDPVHVGQLSATSQLIDGRKSVDDIFNVVNLFNFNNNIRECIDDKPR